jgi:hypothetical protein
VTRATTGRQLASGAIVSIGLSCAAWLSLLARWLGGDWLFVPAFLLLGLTGAIVGLAASLIERTRMALLALLVGCIAPVVILIWIASLAPDALS